MADDVKPRPRIKTLSIRDFRAFPGPDAVDIELGGKHLFIFGENGSGKSTLFHALDGLFYIYDTADEAREELETHANRFTPDGHKGQPEVSIMFDDDQPPAVWSMSGHPADTSGGGADARVVNAAWARAIFDYRSLLRTNYDHGDDEVNLFDLCVDTLLDDYVTIDGRKLGEIWADLQDMLDRGQIRDVQKQEINQLSRAFNDGLAEALKATLPLINKYLDKLGQKEVRVESIDAKRIAYNNAGLKDERDYNDCEVLPRISYRGENVQYPQLFLNEARLSALALAMFLAARKLSETQTQNDMPRILVMDDVLIGLDQSNRVPLIDVLCEDFQDWQFVILTHDRNWFDIARRYIRQGHADKYWTFQEIHARQDHTVLPVVTRVGTSAAVQALSTARSFLADGYVYAAGNAARLATEFALREFCDEKGIKVLYTLPPRHTAASKFLEAIKAWDGTDRYKPATDSIETYTSILMNPLSHGGTAQVHSTEILAAIEVVDKLLLAMKLRAQRDTDETG